MFYLRFIILLLLCNYSSTSYSQLASFNINAVVTDELCTNNGQIVMSASGTTPNSTIVYRLYLAPDFTTAIAETSGTTFTSLGAGNYRIVATQALNGSSNTASIDLVINNLVEELDFEMSDSGAADCATTATIIVEVLSGNPVSYEIISGPVLVPLQSSNLFPDLPSGTYLVRVFDDCGDALSKSYTLTLGSNNLSVGPPTLPDVYTSCDSVEIQNQISSNAGAILYPLTVNYTVFAPDGSVAQNYTQTITSGPAENIELAQVINLFGNQVFSVQIEVTDNCNNTFTETFPINPRPKLSFAKFEDECGNAFFTISITNYFPPFGLNFSSPSGFNPVAFSPAYPGPYNNATVAFGDIDNTVPFGEYLVSAVDSCNRSATLSFSLIPQPIVPSIITSNNGCDSDFGTIVISLPNGREIVSITLLQAPPAYTGITPQSLPNLIDGQGTFVASNFPVGDYLFFIKDSCGNEFEVEVEIPAFVFGELVAEARPTCSPIFGSVKLSTTNGVLVKVFITSAPPTFQQLFPFEVSVNINSDGNFYMSDLPAGLYTFSTVDFCGYTSQITVNVVGYNSSNTGFSINRKCGAFDIILDDTDESITGKTFWLQKFFPATNTWGHPYTEVAFVEGSIPNATTALQLVNPGTLLNIFLTGDFRIIKVYETFGNAAPLVQCTDIYAEFIVSAELLIAGIYNLNCIGGSGPNDLVMDVIGVDPLDFQITSPFFLDNGNSNVFSNLAPGIYNILVTDFCGNIRNIAVEIGTLLPLTRATQPVNLFECRDDGLQFDTFSLIDQNTQVLGNQEASTYSVSYHLTQADADSGANPLPDGYTNITNPQTIYVRVEHKSIKLCYATTSFSVAVGANPVLTPTSELFICDGFTKKLTADPGYASYEWSTGETTQSIIVNQSGTYTVTVKNIYGEFSCPATKDFIVTASGPATIKNIETSDWSAADNSATITVEGKGKYIYSLDNEIFQTSSTFTNLLPGFYTVYIKDIYGCGTVEGEFVLLNYPKYFTPNGDGFNDTWQINFSSFEPKLNADIFDRFGKFLIRLKGGETGWDGTYNGQNAVSTDYWFVVTRQDGKVYRGHFSLKR